MQKTTSFRFLNRFDVIECSNGSYLVTDTGRKGSFGVGGAVQLADLPAVARYCHNAFGDDRRRKGLAA